jgi:hypothetical protein
MAGKKLTTVALAGNELTVATLQAMCDFRRSDLSKHKSSVSNWPIMRIYLESPGEMRTD